MPIIHFDDVPAGFDITSLFRLIMTIIPKGAKFMKPSVGDEHIIMIGGTIMILKYHCPVLALSAELIDGNNLSPSMKKKQKDQYEVFETMSETIKAVLKAYETEEIQAFLADENSTSNAEENSTSNAEENSTSNAETSSADI
jgi:hypothetical protein